MHTVSKWTIDPARVLACVQSVNWSEPKRGWATSKENKSDKKLLVICKLLIGQLNLFVFWILVKYIQIQKTQMKKNYLIKTPVAFKKQGPINCCLSKYNDMHSCIAPNICSTGGPLGQRTKKMAQFDPKPLSWIVEYMTVWRTQRRKGLSTTSPVSILNFQTFMRTVLSHQR